jgi:hypothetical protein
VLLALKSNIKEDYVMAEIAKPDPGCGYGYGFGYGPRRGFATIFLIILILLLFPGFFGCF